MASDERDLFDITFGLLMKKDRKTAGNMTQELVVREMEHIKAQLDALAKSHLLTSITLFKEGVLSLFKVLDRKYRGKYHKETTKSTGDVTVKRQTKMFAGSPRLPIRTLSRGLKEFKLTDLDKENWRLLSTAKDDFHQARLKATEAFNNEVLSTLNRVQAIAIRVAAKILENVDHPEEALAVCRMSLEDLHSLKGVQESFGVELTKGFKSIFRKEERRQIIASVCQINRAIYDVMSMVGKSGELLTLPLIGEGKEAVNPLHDSRVAEVLGRLEMDQFSVQPLTLGQDDDKENKPKIPQGVAANSQGHVVVGDEWDRNVKVFDRIGKFQYSIPCLLSDKPNEFSTIADVATDGYDNVYVLIEVQTKATVRYQVCVFKKKSALHSFPLREQARTVLRMTLNKEDEVLVLADSSNEKCVKSIVEVYNNEGRFMHSFGEKRLKYSEDLSVAGDDRILVLDRDDDCVLSIHVFYPNGKQSFQLKVNAQKELCNRSLRPSISCYQSLNQVVVALPCQNSLGNGHCVKIVVYALRDDNYEFVRSIELATDELVSTRGITVTLRGHVAVGLLDKSEGNSRVIVV